MSSSYILNYSVFGVFIFQNTLTLNTQCIKIFEPSEVLKIEAGHKEALLDKEKLIKFNCRKFEVKPILHVLTEASNNLLIKIPTNGYWVEQNT